MHKERIDFLVSWMKKPKNLLMEIEDTNSLFLLTDNRVRIGYTEYKPGKPIAQILRKLEAIYMRE